MCSIGGMQMPDQPTVSVCVTTYQHAAYIRQCLASVLAQGFAGTLEVLVGDDGSTDGTRDAIDAVARDDARVRPFHHPDNLGPTGNLRFLVSRARGRFIAHLDGDDFWMPSKLSAQLPLMQADAGVVAVYCNATIIGGGDRRLGAFNKDVPLRIDLHALLRRGNFLNHSSLVYRAQARDAVLGIAKPFVDYRLHIRLLRFGALAYVDEELVGHRWRTGGSMISTMPGAVYEGQLDAFREAVTGGATNADVQSAIGHYWGKIMIQAVLAGRWADALKWARELRDDPVLRVSTGRLLAAAMLAGPRAIASWSHRHRRGQSVYFP